MNEDNTMANAWFRQAEQKAAQYFEILQSEVKKKTYATRLTEDFQAWKNNHIHLSWLSLSARTIREPHSKDSFKYIRWLEKTGKLDDYLFRSVSYMYMRDLGKTLDCPHTQMRIKKLVNNLKSHLVPSTNMAVGETPGYMSIAGFYRWAQKENIETTAIWLIRKLKDVSNHLPKKMSAEHAQRKLIKIIIGVVMHVMEEMQEDILPSDRSKQLDEAIRLGYSYGLTYPYIDDLLDSGALNEYEKERYSEMLRSTLLTGIVPELGMWDGDNGDIIRFIHMELRDAFEYIKNHQGAETKQAFFEQAYVFYQSQNMDRTKSLSNNQYTNEELYLPIILKSSASRLIVRPVIGASTDEGYEQRTFYYGIYNQLADDFADLFEDLRDGAVTPYTYYLKYHTQRKDLINPFELYWAVIAHLIHQVYHSDVNAAEVLLNRAINGLKRYKERHGSDKYNEMMGVFATDNPKFNRLIYRMVQKADDVDFFDKLLRDQMVLSLQNEKKDKEYFIETVKTVRNQINDLLQIPKDNGISPMKEPLIDAANYSLDGDGKRLRPILTWVMGVYSYGLDPAAIAPLLRSLEYMHTASLIFDDLPSQDNASTRRGRPTLHQIYDSSTAELTGLYLMQKAIEEQSSLRQFDPVSVVSLIHYSSQKAGEMCMGQAMDLNSKGKALTLDQLNMICYYKTGIAFEASLVMPAILARVPEEEIAILKKYAYHAGIAFQIKDDLLDHEGDRDLLGKPTGQDIENNTSSFVTVLGLVDATKAMWEHYCLAVEVLKEIPQHKIFLKQLLDYLVNRDT
ncbi:polyprenyl synthetase family protein [Paenibacillus dakarensis]|uniref:polyprenyl synthetase family protein n=1 Tax=Paenibacillus dakarensis TaxID=1527293 RepID=UPI0006D5AE81|nr:polyprenyl synthetase family protein [Paenibacillus dakarensis]